jgi:acetyltransferase-like isoleucine patch superfamily enzyme
MFYDIITCLRKAFCAVRSRYYVCFYSLVYGTQCGKNVRIYGRTIIHGPGKIIIGANTHTTSRRAITELVATRKDAVLEIGEGCLLNGAVIGVRASVSIGKSCIIAEAYIRDSSAHGITPTRRRIPGSEIIAPVIIEDNVWIGSHTHVMPGVRIGENSIIGVNSVVTKSIPKNVFAAGNPARVIKPLTDMESPLMEEPLK